MNALKWPGLLALAALAAPCHAQEEGGVSPYRPSVSSPAQLPLAGQLELELGVLNAKTGAARRTSLPYTLKLAFNEQWGVLLGGEAHVSARDGAARASGAGDTTLVLKRAFLVDAATAFGLELAMKMPTAKQAIGSGKRDYTVNGIFSKDAGGIHIDTNLNLSRLGDEADGAGRTQTGLSAALSMPLAPQWGASAELSGTRRRGAGHTAQLLLAATYSPSKQLVIDFGVAHGLSRTTPDWSLFGGVVLPLGRLW
ncbi:transporter [Janthinobacterium fluminis]|uniref:Transporter n=1 Tax=Janthinobacterium fluminis TaxID=2987524 RepID=A0ABT5JZL9_9BURK|nr:transporter [Janthinobacterium fluminis]MDC8758182.1 transporter [Janthinobacterium fluminis]